MGSGGVVVDPISATVGAIGDIASGFINRKSQEESDDRNWRHTVQMWNMNNEYNSPVNQMRRLQDAGLNPNLVYGQMTAGNATQPSVPQSGASKFNLDLSRFVTRRNKYEEQMAEKELERVGLENSILRLKKEAIAHENSLNKHNTLPTKAPWVAQYLFNKMNQAERYVNDPETLGNKVATYVGGQVYDVTHPVSSGSMASAFQSVKNAFNPNSWGWKKVYNYLRR